MLPHSLLVQALRQSAEISRIKLKDGPSSEVSINEMLEQARRYGYGLTRHHFTNHPSLTLAELRDMLGTSRKVALPLLEYFDLQKYTAREGDTRRPGPKLRE